MQIKNQEGGKYSFIYFVNEGHVLLLLPAAF